MYERVDGGWGSRSLTDLKSKGPRIGISETVILNNSLQTPAFRRLSLEQIDMKGGIKINTHAAAAATR